MAISDNLVTPAWLWDHLHEPGLVVIDCRFALADPNQGRRQYEQGHVPGGSLL